MAQFTVAPLEKDQIDGAYPLVRMAAPEVAPDAWRGFAERLIDNGDGILCVFAGDSTLHGLAAYRLDEGLRYGRMLRVDTIVTFELDRAAPARTALCAALERVAQQLECESLTLAMPSRGYADPDSAKAEAWSALGVGLDSVIFAKKVPRSAETALSGRIGGSTSSA